jgi:hypothetical protein
MGARVSIAFDPMKTHSDNLDVFLTSLETRHAEFGSLLRQQVAILIDGVEDDASRRQARDKFNRLVKKSLDELVDRGEEGSG